jgi:hypothetical protein
MTSREKTLVHMHNEAKKNNTISEVAVLVLTDGNDLQSTLL